MTENSISVVISDAPAIYEWARSSFREVGVQRLNQTDPHGAWLSLNNLDKQFLQYEHTGIYISPETQEYLPQLALNSVLEISQDEKFHPPYGHYDLARVSRVAALIGEQGTESEIKDLPKAAKLLIPFIGRTDVQVEVDFGLKSRAIDAEIQSEWLKAQLGVFDSSATADLGDILKVAAEKPEFMKILKRTIEHISTSNERIDIKMSQLNRPRFGVDFTDLAEVEAVLHFYAQSYQTILRALYAENSISQPDVTINFGKPVEFSEVKDHFFPDVDFGLPQ